VGGWWVGLGVRGWLVVVGGLGGQAGSKATSRQTYRHTGACIHVMGVVDGPCGSMSSRPRPALSRCRDPLPPFRAPGRRF
jgi:hypothetical protein